MPAANGQRSKSIVQQPNLLDGDFLPLYKPTEPDGTPGLRKAPDDILLALRDKFVGYNIKTQQCRGMYLENLLMNKLTTMLRIKISAKALLANTEVKANPKNGYVGKSISAVEHLLDSLGLPGAKFASWSMRQVYEYKISKVNKHYNSVANDDIDVRTHIAIFAYLFALIVSPDLQKYLPDSARESLEKWYKNKDGICVNNIPTSVHDAFDNIVHDVVHVIEKDLAERRTSIHYEDMLISAIMGVPANRFQDESKRNGAFESQEHISSKYQTNRFKTKQVIIVHCVNPVLTYAGFRPYNETISTAALITMKSREKLASIKIHSKQLNLWKELADLMAMHRQAIVGLSSNNTQVGMAKFFAEDVLEVSNRERFLQSKPSAAKLLAAKAAAVSNAEPIVNEKYTAVLQSIVKQFNATTAKQQILKQSTDKITRAVDTLYIENMTRIDDSVLDGIFTMFREEQVKLPASVHHIKFEGAFDFEAIDPMATEKFANEMSNKYPNVKIHFPEAKTFSEEIAPPIPPSRMPEPAYPQVSVELDNYTQDSFSSDERLDMGSSDSDSTPTSDNTPITPVSLITVQTPKGNEVEDASLKQNRAVTFSVDASSVTTTEPIKPFWSTSILRKTPARPVAPSVASTTSESSSAMSPYHNVLRSTPRSVTKENPSLKPQGSYFRRAEHIKEAANARDSMRAQLMAADTVALKETSLRVRAETAVSQFDPEEIEIATLPMPAAKGYFGLKRKN